MIIGPGVNIQSGVNMVVPQDQFFANETLLLSYGPNVAPAGDAQSFTQDASTNNFAVTINGDAKNETFSPFWPDGYWSNYFDGAGDCLTVPSNATFAFGTGNFTIECWVYLSAYNGTYGSQIFGGHNYGVGADLIFMVNTTGKLYFQISGSSTGAITSTSSVSLNTWTHVAVVRSGGTVTPYINGTNAGGGASYTTSISSTINPGIGSSSNNNNAAALTGYISNLRVVNGTAVYTSAFTTPTAPLTAITNTSLLTCQSNRFIDNSTNNFAITVNGNTSVTVTEPFGFRFGTVTATVPNSSAVTSGYSSTAFNGTSDYLVNTTISNPLYNLSSGSWTVEAWIYKTASGAASILTLVNAAGNNSGLSFYVNASNQLAQDNGVTGTTAAGTIPLNTWTHVAAVCNGTNTTLYINGASVGSAITQLPNTAQFIYLGSTATPNQFFPGYISNLRITRGVAVYTGNFTVPTAPLGLTQSAGTNISAITTGQTVFLLNGTTYGNNKNYIDSSTNNFSVTLNGNPSQIPLTPFYGTNYGMQVTTSDSIAVPNINFASNNFTIEGWYYFTGTTFAVGSPALTNFWGTTNGTGAVPKLILSADATNLTLLQTSTNIVQNAHGMVPNRWYHVAVVRTGTGANQVFIYINGTAINTTSTALGSLSGITGVFNIGFAGEAYGTRFQGYISNFRMVNGTALYTSAFTPSTTPLTNISNTFLLTCQSSRFVDNSNFGATITRTGNPAISQFIPFNVTYSAALYGGSMYCAATSDFVSFAPAGTDSFGTGDFTVECWLNPLAATAVNLSLPSANTNTWGFLTFSGQLYWQENGSNLGGGGFGSVIQQAWNHLAVCRSGTTIRWFVNGIQVNSATNSFNYSGAPATRNIGPGSGGSAPAIISNFRIVRGTALYTASFTPPSIPLTAVTNTSLLLNTNNVNTYDLTLSNPVTNVSGASQSTRQPFTVPTTGITYSGVSTFGSAYFDGTGDYLNNIGTASSFNFLHNSSALFTVEAWVYTTAGGVQRTLIDTNGAGSAGIGTLVLIDTDNTLRVFITKGSSGNPVCDSRSNSTVPLNQWVHLAVTYDQSLGSTNAKFYINGVASGTGNKTANAPTNSNASYSMAIGSYNGPGSYFTGFISNLRINNSIVYTSAFTPSTFPLSAIPTTSLLTVQQDGPANNSGFIDSGPNNLLVTRNGNTTQGSFTPYWPNGYWSNYFNGSSGLQLPSSSAFSIATSTTPFTIEAWIYPTASGGAIFSEQWPQTGAVNIAFTLSDGTNVYGSGLFPALGYYNGTSWVTAAESNTAVVLNTWSHLAVVFTGSTTRIYINGIDRTASSPTPATTWGVTGNNGEGWYIGRNWDTVSTIYFTGYISNLRFTNGTAVYTTAFTPSITPLTVTANTTLLACQSNRYRDNSINNLSFTVSNGTPSVQRFQPFSPPAAYTPALYGASAYFDGTGDSLQTTNNPLLNLPGDFTIELWAYFTVLSGNRILLERWASTISGTWQFYWRGTGTSIVWYVVDTIIIQDPSATTIAVNTWNHIAVSRSGTTVRMFINGVQVGSATNSNTLTNTQTLSVGRQASTGTNDFIGYMCDVRITASALYTSNFTPPTQPLQPVANTQYLLNVNNAAIYDRTGNNDLETLGGAQTVTSVRRLGAGSMYFDGNGDYLNIPSGPINNLTQSNFTIEFWMYPTATPATAGWLYANVVSGATYAVSLSYRSTNRFEIYFKTTGGTTFGLTTSTGTAPLNTWSYITLTVSGSTAYFFINGVLDSTIALSSNIVGAGTQSYIGFESPAGASSFFYTGYLDNFQITRGVARYTANFTTPVNNPIYQ
jgi:hypothetical protein